MPSAPSTAGWHGPVGSPNPLSGPVVPPPLPADLPNGFKDNPPPYWGACGWYASVGGMALQRARLENVAVALLDPVNLKTGNPPPPNAPVAQSSGDLPMNFALGVQATVGYQWDVAALELSGFYIPANTSAHTTAAPGQLDSFFINPPLGFEGDNGMWLHADLIRTSLRTALGSAEVNLRRAYEPHPMWEFLAGLRYLDVQERLQIFSGDDDLTVLDIHGRPDPTRQATYTVKTHNRIAAPQLGLQFNAELTCWLTASAVVKGAWGADIFDVDVNLQRGDGFFGFAGHRSDTIFSHVYEAGLFLDVHPWYGLRFRAGYTTLFVLHVPEASDQVDFDLTHTVGNPRNVGNIFYHGPTIELELYF